MFDYTALTHTVKKQMMQSRETLLLCWAFIACQVPRSRLLVKQVGRVRPVTCKCSMHFSKDPDMQGRFEACLHKGRLA